LLPSPESSAFQEKLAHFLKKAPYIDRKIKPIINSKDYSNNIMNVRKSCTSKIEYHVWQLIPHKLGPRVLHLLLTISCPVNST